MSARREELTPQLAYILRALRANRASIKLCAGRMGYAEKVIKRWLDELNLPHRLPPLEARMQGAARAAVAAESERSPSHDRGAKRVGPEDTATVARNSHTASDNNNNTRPPGCFTPDDLGGPKP